MSKNLIFIALATLVVVTSAIYQGVITDRWGNEISGRLNVYTQRLEGTPGIPTQIGNWVAHEVPVDEAQFKASHCHGRISRAYKHSVTGETITVFLVSGKAYHLTVHTPDWCYVAAGYEMEKDPINYTFDVPGIPKPEVLTAKFKKVTPTETTQLRILWSYSEDGKWTAPSFAKYAFAGKPALYKVYFIRNIASSIASLSEDPAVEFASEFLSAIHDVLFPQDPTKNPRLSRLPSRKQKANHVVRNRHFG